MKFRRCMRSDPIRPSWLALDRYFAKTSRSRTEAKDLLAWLLWYEAKQVEADRLAPNGWIPLPAVLLTKNLGHTWSRQRRLLEHLEQHKFIMIRRKRHMDVNMRHIKIRTDTLRKVFQGEEK